MHFVYLCGTRTNGKRRPELPTIHPKLVVKGCRLDKGWPPDLQVRINRIVLRWEWLLGQCHVDMVHVYMSTLSACCYLYMLHVLQEVRNLRVSTSEIANLFVICN